MISNIILPILFIFNSNNNKIILQITPPQTINLNKEYTIHLDKTTKTIINNEDQSTSQILKAKSIKFIDSEPVHVMILLSER